MTSILAEKINQSINQESPSPSNEDINDLSSWNYDFYSKEKKLPKEPSFASTLLVTGLPQIPRSKEAKLISVIRKKFKKFGRLSKDAVQLLYDEEAEHSFKLCTVGFENEQSASSALAMTKFDKKHAIKSYVLNEYFSLEKFIKVEEARLESLEKKSLNVWGSAIDERRRSQYLIRDKDDTLVFWNDPLRTMLDCRDPFLNFSEKNSIRGDDDVEETDKKKLILSEACRTDSLAYWSPTGKYLLLTNKRRQISICCDAPINEISCFSEDMTSISFTPGEKFIVTRNLSKTSKIWDFLTGRCLLSIASETNEKIFLKWRFDDSFFAYKENEHLKIYDVKTMMQVFGSPLTVFHLENFNWAPDAALIAIRSKDLKQKLIKILLVEVPSLETKMTHCYQGDYTASFKWHANFLVTSMRSYSNKKLPKHSFFDFFDYKGEAGRRPFYQGERFAFSESILHDDKNKKIFPIVLEAAFSSTENLIAIVYIHNQRHNLLIHDLSAKETIIHLANEKVNKVFWSPCGRKLVAAGLSTSEDPCNGHLIFIDCTTRLVINREDHFNCNSAEWSPCARYFTSAILQNMKMPDTRMPTYSYNIYNSIGEIQATYSSRSLYQFKWRPYSRIANQEQIDKLRGEMAKHRVEFSSIAEEIRQLNVRKEERGRDNLLANYKNIMGVIEGAIKARREEMDGLRGDLYCADGDEEVEEEEEVRVVLEETEEKVMEKSKFVLD